MAVTGFDTLNIFQQLKAGGFQEGQAQALAKCFADTSAVGLQELATKDDLLLAKTELKADLREVEQRLHAKIDTLDVKTAGQFTHLKWMIGSAFVLLVTSVGGAIFMLSRILVQMPSK